MVIQLSTTVGTRGDYLPCYRLYKYRASRIFGAIRIRPLNWHTSLGLYPYTSPTNIQHSTVNRIGSRWVGKHFYWVSISCYCKALHTDICKQEAFKRKLTHAGQFNSQRVEYLDNDWNACHTKFIKEPQVSPPLLANYKTSQPQKEMTTQQFLKFKIDWDIFTKITNLPLIQFHIHCLPTMQKYQLQNFTYSIWQFKLYLGVFTHITKFFLHTVGDTIAQTKLSRSPLSTSILIFLISTPVNYICLMFCRCRNGAHYFFFFFFHFAKRKQVNSKIFDSFKINIIGLSYVPTAIMICPGFIKDQFIWGLANNMLQ